MVFLSLKIQSGFFAREGVIIECPLNGQYHNALDVILMSQTDVREMVDDEWPLVIKSPQAVFKLSVSS